MIPSAPLGTDAAAGRPQGLGASAGAGPDRAAAERRFRFELAAHPGSPAQARRLTRARLIGWSVCEDICDTAVLIVSELVTNAIVHTASDVVVCELHDSDDVVRIAVRDEGCAPGDPHPSPQQPEEEHGRGLLLVEALCQAWGAQEHGPGLLVWADLPRRSAALTAPAPALTPVAPHRAGLGEFLDTLDECEDDSAGPHLDPAAPRDDLGWGAPPKPVPSDDPGDADEHAEQRHRGPTAVPRPRPAPGSLAGSAAASASASAVTSISGGPSPKVAPQWHRTPDHDGPDRHQGPDGREGRHGWTPGQSAAPLPFEHGRERGRI